MLEPTMQETLASNVDYVKVDPRDHKTGGTHGFLGKYMPSGTLKMASLVIDLPGRTGESFLQPYSATTKHANMGKLMGKACKDYTSGYTFQPPTRIRKGWQTAVNQDLSVQKAQEMVARVNAHTPLTAKKNYTMFKCEQDAIQAKSACIALMDGSVDWPTALITPLSPEEINNRVQELLVMWSKNKKKEEQSAEEKALLGTTDSEEEGGDENDPDGCNAGEEGTEEEGQSEPDVETGSGDDARLPPSHWHMSGHTTNHNRHNQDHSLQANTGTTALRKRMHVFARQNQNQDHSLQANSWITSPRQTNESFGACCVLPRMMAGG